MDRIPESYAGGGIAMIVAELEWSVPIHSERQLQDVAAMLDVAGDAADRPYVERLVKEFGPETAWQRVNDLPR